ncbi:DNA cytosine methyltransferase [Streptomyces sp. NPDC052192]|uniref:DNA cytosine methyltransferase n=1 Tax=Streptomyces sp. NPDC052192 TaxID=3155052 RepID=UPI00344645FC
MTATPPHQQRNSPFVVVDLFAGPGGLDVAAEVLGVPSIGIEWDADAVETRLAANLRTVSGDVRDYGPCDKRFREANVLAGGPPCQTFSIAGSGTGRKALDEVLRFIGRMHAWYERESAGEEGETWDDIQKELDDLKDVRTGLVLQPLRWIFQALLQPRDGGDVPLPFEVVILEQVPAVIEVWHAYERVLSSVGYKTAAKVFHTEQYGVPQTRRRAVLVARRGDEEVQMPAPTHSLYRKGAAPAGGLFDQWVSMDRGLTAAYEHEDVPDALRLPLPFRVVSNYGSGGDPKARGRRDSNLPSATITGKWARNRIVSADAHETERRRLSVPEAGVLQSFPYRYPWSGNDQAQQIGNAVPPRFGVHILCAALGLSAPDEAVWERLLAWPPRPAVAPGGESRTSPSHEQRLPATRTRRDAAVISTVAAAAASARV